jgi:hypothetical protein
MRKRFLRLAGVASVAGLAILAAVPAISQGGSAPPARYTIDAGTISGMGAMGANGGGGLNSAMAMMRGGGNQVAHELRLRLGSSQAPAGDPKADHFIPQGMRMGASLPLVTPRQVTGTQEYTPGQMPTGRLLLFWGCGEHAGPGQPVVIDFSKLARGQVPPGLYAQSLNLPEDWSITSANSKTFGEWPNERDPKPVPGNASLLGTQRIASTYAPEISFELANDFMSALRPSTADAAGGAVNLSWNSVPTATGYYAWVMAMNPDQSGQPRDMVWWTSSSTQQFGGPMWDWLSPSTVQKLITAKTVMPPSQTSCTIPAEVREQGGPFMMTNLYAYGPQADFSYPVRPANAARSWQPDWIVRVRFRANAMVMHGMPGMGDFGASSESSEEAQPAQQGQELPRCKGLSGIAKRAAGLCQ